MVLTPREEAQPEKTVKLSASASFEVKTESRRPMCVAMSPGAIEAADWEEVHHASHIIVHS